MKRYAELIGNYKNCGIKSPQDNILDYNGEIIIALHNDTDEAQDVQGGERIAQLVILPYVQAEFCEVKELEDTKRGAGGFGSTDQLPGQMHISDYGI